MSISHDITYLYKISHRLSRFKQITNRLYNIRCPICGDSKKSQYKARGYFYERKNALFYKCHNCSTSLNFYSFLYRLEPDLAKAYTRDKFLDGKRKRNYTSLDISKKPNLEKRFQYEKFRSFIVPVMKSSSDEAKQYVKKRQLPSHRLQDVYYLHNPQNIISFLPKYKKLLLGLGRCLAIPFLDANDDFIGLQCRTISDTYKVYINMKLDENGVLVYNLNNIDSKKPIFVLEGVFDSFFLPNAVAAVSASLGKIEQASKAKDITYVYDNEPRNKQLLFQIEKSIEQNKKVVIWPKNIQEKDVNDMVLAGMKPNKILSVVKQNTFQGPRAKMEYQKWKKVST